MSEPNGKTLLQMTEEAHEGRALLAFEAHMEQFLKRFAPKDERERIEFDIALHSLVRLVYRDAQAPMVKEFAAATRLMIDAGVFNSLPGMYALKSEKGDQ